MDAFSRAGRETFSSKQMEICSEVDEVATCELHQQTLNFYEGAYIASTRKVIVKNTASECIASLEADVKIYTSQHDPKFALKAKINGSQVKRIGEPVRIVGEVNKKAHLSLFVWSPTTTGDDYLTIFPNEFDTDTIFEGKFELPSPTAVKKYQFYAEIPQNNNKLAINEWLFLLATKSRFEILEKESSESFYRRLDELGRKNWRLEQLGYTIIQ